MQNSNVFKVRPIADTFGLVGSAACALHCVLVPVLLIAGSTLPSFLAGEGFHHAALWIILPSAILAFSLGCWRHKDRWVLLLGISGLVGLIAAVTVLHDIAGETGERVVTLIAAALLITAHIRNFRLCRRMDCREHDEA